MRQVLLLMAFGILFLFGKLSAQTTSGGVVWGPVVKLSPTDPNRSGGNYTPLLAAQGDTIHCIWETGLYRLPYMRSTDDGRTWETPRELMTDSVKFPCPHGWGHIIVNSGKVYIFFGAPDSGGLGPVCFIWSTDRGDSWSYPIRATTDTSGANWSASVLGDTMADVYVPDVNDLAQYPRITRSTNAGSSWTRSALEMPSSSSNQLRVALTPGLLNFFHPGDSWPGPAPEIVLHRSTDLADTWSDSIVISPLDSLGSDKPEVATFSEDKCNTTTIAVMWRGEDYGGAWFSAGMATRLSYDNGKSWQALHVVSDVPFGSFHNVTVRGNTVAAVWMHEESDFGGFQIKARISYDGGTSWEGVTNLTPSAINAEVPSVALAQTAVHVAWEEYLDSTFNIYYCRGERIRKNPVLSLSTGLVQFDTVGAGLTVLDTLTVTNTGIDTLSIGAAFTNDDHFRVSPERAKVNPGNAATFTIAFTPDSIGEYAGRIFFVSNASTSPDYITVKGTGRWCQDTITYPEPGAWALVSIPLIPYQAPSLPSLFAYEGGYVQRDTLIFGRGYWAKPDTGTKTYSGIAIFNTEEELKRGWNIIGALAAPVALDQISSLPPGIVVSPLYGYRTGTYVPVDTLYPGRGYWVKLNQAGNLLLSSDGSFTAGAFTKIAGDGEMPPPPPDSAVIWRGYHLPKEVSLMQNYPNPFNPTTKITYAVPGLAIVSLKVYDLVGREIASLVNEMKEAGEYEVEWNAENFPSGVYYCQLSVRDSQRGTTIQTKKLLLIK